MPRKLHAENKNTCKQIIFFLSESLNSSTRWQESDSCCRRDRRLLAAWKGPEDWNVCHRSGVARSVLLCPVCRGGVECKLENKRGWRRRVAGARLGGVGSTACRGERAGNVFGSRSWSTREEKRCRHFCSREGKFESGVAVVGTYFECNTDTFRPGQLNWRS